MADLIFADPELAALYDATNHGRHDYVFYRPMVMAAGSIGLGHRGSRRR